MFIRLVAGPLERKSRRSRARLICIFRLSEQGPVRKLAARKYSVKAFKAKSEKLQNIKKIWPKAFRRRSHNELFSLSLGK